ncbi:MAG: DUF3307 domain-containing protein [Bacteroidota bacterium]
MDLQEIDILLRLIIAHLLADFPFQSDTMAVEKKRGPKSLYFWSHILIVGIVTYLLLGQWANWKGPILIMIVHGIIDALKVEVEAIEWFDNSERWKQNKGKWLFITDQFLHLCTLVIFWAITSQAVQNREALLTKLDQKFFSNIDVLVIIIAYLVITMPIGILIGFITRKWQDDKAKDDENDVSNSDSLKDAGKTIGMIERSLILTFILLAQYQAIGFLIAAKSVFRFGDLKESGQRKRTEYILIGTLISFTLSILTGIFTQFLIRTF